MNEREISKTVPCPKLNQNLISLLTELVYLPNDPLTPADCLFVFGNRNFSDTANVLQSCIDQHLSPVCIISGGTPDFANHEEFDPIPESERILSLIDLTTSSVQIKLEKTATSTWENVSNSLPLFPQPMESLIYICLWHSSRRANLTLHKFLPPDTKLSQLALPKKDLQTAITIVPSNWMDSQIGRDRTYSEYLRIKKYGERGDIHSNDQTRSLVNTIAELI